MGWGGACISVHVSLHMKYSRCYDVAAGWGMYSRSCQFAHEVDATLWLSLGTSAHVHVNVHHEVDATWLGGACINVHVNLHMK